MHHSRPGGKCRPGRQPRGAQHSLISPDHHHPPASPLVGIRSKAAQMLGGRRLGKEHGTSTGGGTQANVRHHHITVKPVW